MKKLNYIILLFGLLVFLRCSTTTNKQQKTVYTEDLDVYGITSRGIQILTIDSCEYVWIKNGYGAGLTHKGNCKFCINRNIK